MAVTCAYFNGIDISPATSLWPLCAKELPANASIKAQGIKNGEESINWFAMPVAQCLSGRIASGSVRRLLPSKPDC
jgi:hypothetical protein